MAEATGDRPYLDPQNLTDTDSHVYEAVATLEHMRRAITADTIAEATGLDRPAVDAALQTLTGQGVLLPRESREGKQFELGRRDWSAAPDQPSR